MFNKAFFLLLIMSLSLSINAQPLSVSEIDDLVEEIDKNLSSDSLVLDANEVYGQTFDGGGVYILHGIDGQLVKFSSAIGTSYGRFIEITYLKDDLPIKFTEIEMNFKWKEDDTGWDYSEIKRVFKKDTYVVNYQNADTEIRTEGKRVVSSRDGDFCGLYERDPDVERARKLYSAK